SSDGFTPAPLNTYVRMWIPTPTMTAAQLWTKLQHRKFRRLGHETRSLAFFLAIVSFAKASTQNLNTLVTATLKPFSVDGCLKSRSNNLACGSFLLVAAKYCVGDPVRQRCRK